MTHSVIGGVNEPYGPPTSGGRPLHKAGIQRATQITGWGYDGSGNVTSVVGMQRAFTYDAENRQKDGDD